MCFTESRIKRLSTHTMYQIQNLLEVGEKIHTDLSVLWIMYYQAPSMIIKQLF